MLPQMRGIIKTTTNKIFKLSIMQLTKIFYKKRNLIKELENRKKVIDKNIHNANKLQLENKDIQKSIMEIAWKNQELNEELKQLIITNENRKEILLKKENKIQEAENEIEERKTNIRKDEIQIEAIKAKLRKDEYKIKEREIKVDSTVENVRKRENEAKKLKESSIESKQKYDNLFSEIEHDREEINNLKKEINKRNKESKRRSRKAKSIFEKAEEIDAIIKEKEAKFETKREEIENKLKDKISEYSRKLKDLENNEDFIESIKFDKSKEGKEAKIVVKETIRQAKKAIDNLKSKFDELDEKYSSGTFKGFSTPISEIEIDYENLKTQYEQIKEHFDNTELLPDSVSLWIESIENNIVLADKNIKSWEFSEAYRNIILGLSSCKNYELLLNILNDWAETDENQEADVDIENEDYIDWYEVLDVDENASAEEIKKKYKDLAKKYHPDKVSEELRDEYTKKMSLINKAYSILKDENKREQFNKTRNNKRK